VKSVRWLESVTELFSYTVKYYNFHSKKTAGGGASQRSFSTFLTNNLILILSKSGFLRNVLQSLFPLSLTCSISLLTLLFI